MDARKLSVVTTVLMLLLAGNLLLGVSAQGTEHALPLGLNAAKAPQVLPAPSGRSFNATEHMGYTTSPPTIDGNLNANEWADAATYDIGSMGLPVILYIMFDEDKIYMAIDAIADKTQDTGDPPNGYVSDSSTDYFTVSFDGDNDQKITWKDQWDGAMGQEAPGECPPDLINCYPWLTYQGLDLDRGASTSGGTFRIAGWWCEAYASTSKSMWNVPSTMGGGPNQGNQEPYDYINPGFAAHRTYEYSIPYTGGTGELGLNKLDTVGVTMVVNDANGGASRVIGRMPSGADGLSKPLQVFMLNGKPKVVLAPLTTNIFYTGETVAVSGTGSTDPESEAITYSWDFDYDGFSFQEMATTGTANYVYNTPGTYVIALKVTDPHGAEGIAKTTVTVVQPEYAPTFSNVTPANDQVVMNEGTSQPFSASYNDKNLGLPGEHIYGQWTVNDQVIKSFDSNKAGSQSYTFKSNYTGDHSAGKYKIQLLINDTYTAGGKYTGGSMTTIQSWNLTVSNVNRAPLILTHVPEPTEVTTDEEHKVVFTITKSDPDGDVMTTSWLVDNKPQTGGGDTFTYLNQFDYTAAGPHIIKVVVKDNGDPPQNTTFQWAVTVGNINKVPIIKTISPTSKSLTLDEGKSLDFKITAEDPDLDALEYIWLLNGEAIDGAVTNSYTFKTDFGSAQGQDYTLKVVVTDIYQASVFKEWTITVKDIDRPPVIVVTKPSEGDRFPLSETVSFDASRTSDPDFGDSLSYVWNFGDSSSKTVATTTHKYLAPGAYTVQLIVTSTHNKLPVEIERIINITIDASELEVGSVTMDKAKITEGDKLTISVDVANKGTLDISTMTVKLYMDDTILVGQMDKQSVTAGQNTTVVFTWAAASPGTHRFKAQLVGDKDSVISDKKVTSFDVVVEKKAAPIIGGGGGGIPLYLIALLLAVIVIIIVIFAVVSSRKKKREAEERARVEAEKAKAAEDERKRAEAAAYAASMQQYQPAYPPPPPQHMVVQQAPLPPPPPPAPAASPFVSRRARRKMEEEEEPEPTPPKVDITPEVAKVAAEAGVCPSCGEAVEKTWLRCQKCDQKLIVPAAPTAAVPIKPPPPPPPATMPKAPPPPPPKPATIPAKPPAPPAAPAAPSNKCPKCGDDIEADWLKCPSCGAGLKAAAAPPKKSPKCPKCGEDVEPEWTKCPFCSSML